MKKAGILAAGEGTRLKEMQTFKPIVKINGTPLLELTLRHVSDFESVSIIFNEAQKKMDLTAIPGLKNKSVNYFFKSTPSSMHSLYEISKRLNIKENEHFFVTMVDSIIAPAEIERFQLFCKTIPSKESGIIVTTYIEDEKPLTLEINNQGNITSFQCPVTEGVLITSGVYYFSYQVLPLLEKMINEGHTKMRNFLNELIKNNHTIRAFPVDKTLDIDRPEDIRSAEAFLMEQMK